MLILTNDKSLIPEMENNAFKIATKNFLQIRNSREFLKILTKHLAN